MKNKNLNKNLYIVLPLLSILIVIGLGIFFIQPKVVTIMEKQASIKQENSRKELLQTKIQKLENLSKRKTELLAQLTAINEALPTQKDVPTLIIQIQKTAQDSDVEIQSIQLSPGKLIDDQAVAKTTDITINLSIRGNYEAIETFLGKVFRGKRLINLESINLASSGSTDSDSGLTASIVMSTYYQPLPPKAADETEEVPEETTADQEVYSKLQSYESLQATGNDIVAPSPTPRATPESSSSAIPSPSASARP